VSRDGRCGAEALRSEIRKKFRKSSGTHDEAALAEIPNPLRELQLEARPERLELPTF